MHDALLKGDRAAKEEFERHYAEDCESWLVQLLLTFRGIDPEIARLRRELSPAELKAHLLSLYPRPYLTALLTFLKNEEFNEISRLLLSGLLKENNKGEN